MDGQEAEGGDEYETMSFNEDDMEEGTRNENTHGDLETHLAANFAEEKLVRTKTKDLGFLSKAN